MYKKVDTDLNFLPREKEVLAFWKQNRVFEKSVELRRGAPGLCRPRAGAGRS